MKEVVKIRYPKSALGLFIIGGALFLFLGGLGMHAFFNANGKDFIALGVGCICWAIALMSFNEMTRKVLISERSIRSTSFFKSQEVLLEDLSGYVEFNHMHKEAKNKELALINKQHRIVMNFFSDAWGEYYDALEQQFKQRIKRLPSVAKVEIVQKRKDIYKNLGIGFGLFLYLLGMMQAISILFHASLVELFPKLAVMLCGILIMLYYKYWSKGYD